MVNHLREEQLSQYGIPTAIMQLMRKWFDDDTCFTPDIRGREIFYRDSTWVETHMVLLYMKAGDREENHTLFVELHGKECLDICRNSLLIGHWKMKPRFPGKTVLESCRRNYAKYFKKMEFEDCSLCKPSHVNYEVFLTAVH